mgnify:CR=1 FL=1
MTRVFATGLIFLLLTSGCRLLPGNAEYFQKKVKKVPVPADQPALVETQKQAARFVADRVGAAKTAAAGTGADVSVQVPLSEAAVVSGPLSTSLGPPASPWPASAPALAGKIDAEPAKLDKKVSGYARSVEPLVGKEIEGTGLFQIGFFTQWLVLAGLAAAAWLAFKTYGLVNPVAGLAGNIIGRVGSKTLSAGLAQVVDGGERFKVFLTKTAALSDDQKAVVKGLFNEAQERAQDRPVQALVRRLTA